MRGDAFRLCLVFVAAAACAPAQISRASLSGSVFDSSQASVPSAAVRATCLQSGEHFETRTSESGWYSFEALPPCSYSLEVSASGFRRATQSNILLQTDETVSVPFQLELGATSEQTSVSARPERLQTATASRSYQWDPRKVKSLPLLGRQAYTLVSLTPGVIFTQEQFGTAAFVKLRGFDANGRFIINGGREGTNQFLLNGAPVSLFGSWQYTPSIDAIQEFRVLTNTYDAQFGRTGGGTVASTLRSGTNSWHGTLFEYFHNAVFDANSTENNRDGVGRGTHITHQFGGFLGGPIRRNRDFLFFGLESFHEVAPVPVVSDTPPLDLRDGQHFSDYGFTIYDPLTAHPCIQGQDTPAGVRCFGPYIRSPFPGNVIPLSRISPIGARILGLYPEPNESGLTQNFLAIGNLGRYHYDQPLAHWDHLFTEKHRLSVVGAFDRGNEFQSANAFTPPAESGNQINERASQNYIAEWTSVLSPETVFDLKLSFGRFTQFFPTSTSQDPPDRLGMTIPRPPVPGPALPPTFKVGYFSQIIGNSYRWNTQNQWDVHPNLLHTFGRHVLHFGIEAAYAAVGAFDSGRANGEFSFSTAWTSQYVRGARNALDGSAIADLLLGTPASGFIDYNGTSYRTWPYFAVYIQDYWKLAPKLSLTLGLRYDVQIPFKERFHRVNAGFDFSVKNPLSDEIIARWKDLKQQYDAIEPAYPYPDPPEAIYGGRLFTSSNRPRPYDTDWTDIQPRLGIAWNLFPKTVLRAGFGIFYRTASQMNQSDGFSQRTNYTSSLDGGVHPSAGLQGPYSLEDPFPTGIFSPTGASLGYRTAVGRAINFDGRQRPIPRTYEYSFGVQREFLSNILFEVSYAGSQTVHDSMPAQFDAIPYAELLKGQADPIYLNHRVPNPFSGILPSSSDLGSALTITEYNLLRPLPIFNGITGLTNPWARYRYDALQVFAEKRILDSSSAGMFSFLLAYTFAKNFEENHRLNPWRLEEKPVHELSALDKTHTFALSGLWDLPIGWGRRWLNGGGRLAGAVLNGWTLDWILTYGSGFPVSRPDALFTCASYAAPGGQTSEHWFNNDRACYQARPLYSLRTANDRFAHIRNPSAPQLNGGIEKTFWMRESLLLQFRGEAFNLTNTPVSGPPITDFRDPRFGRLPQAQANFPRYVQIAAKLVW